MSTKSGWSYWILKWFAAPANFLLTLQPALILHNHQIFCLMHNLTERNERQARTHALILAIGLHLSLGFLLYTQMSTDNAAPQTAQQTKVNVAKETATPVVKTVSQP